MHEVLPVGWVRTKLDEVCLPVATVQPEDSPNVTFTYFDIGSIDNERNCISEPKLITGRSAPGRARQSVRKGDILFSNVRTYLRKIAQIEHNYENPVASTGFTVIRPAEGVSSRFLFFQILSEDFLQPLHLLQTGSSYPAVRARDVLAQPVLLAPTREQERIVAKLEAALSRIQRAEVAARRAQERLIRYRTAVIEAAVTGELTRDWREAQEESGHNDTAEAILSSLLAARRAHWEQSELKRLGEKGKTPKDNSWKSRYPEPIRPDLVDLPKLPESWAWTSLEAIAEISSGISVSQNRVVKNAVELPDLRVANVLRGHLDLTDVRTIRLERERVSDYRLQVGDILFTEGGDRDKLGRGWIWEGQLQECLHQNHVFRARPISPSLVSPMLVSHWGNTFGQQFFLKHGTQTTNLASINQGVLSKLPVPIPPVAEQDYIIHEIDSRLAAADRLAAALTIQLERTRAARETLLREAFAGHLVPQDPSDVPASTLLELIRAEKDRIDTDKRPPHRKRSSITRKRSDPMQEQAAMPESLDAAWETMGHEGDARQLFYQAGFRPENVVQFYEALRATPEVLAAFREIAQRNQQRRVPVQVAERQEDHRRGRFRLIELWLEDFKNLKDYGLFSTLCG